MKRQFLLATFFLVLTSYFSYVVAQEDYGYPAYKPLDVCPQEIVGYEKIATIDLTSPDASIDDWTPGPGARLALGEHGATMTATNTDPYFSISPAPVFLVGDALEKAIGKTLVKIRMRRDNKGMGQIFFATTDEPDYCEKNSVHFEIADDPDWHEYIAAIDIQGTPTRFRFDLGTDVGKADIERIEFYRVVFKPVKFGAHEVNEGALHFDLIGKEKVDAQYYGADTTDAQPSEIELNGSTRVALRYPQKRAFEEIEVVATSQRTQETFSRRFFIFNETVADEELKSNETRSVPTLKNDRLEARFASDASGAEIFRDGKRVAVISPLIVEEGDGAAILPVATDFSAVDLTQVASSANVATKGTRLTPVLRFADENQVEFYLSRVPIDAAREKLGARDSRAKKDAGSDLAERAIDPSSICGSLTFRLNGDLLEFDFDAPCLVHAPVARILGEMEQAVLSGSEYLEKGEHSSSTADIETDEHARYAQPVDWTTAPFASIVTDRCSASLLYDNPKSRAIFAVPNFIDGDANNSRFNICAKQGSGRIRFADALEPIEEAILWSVKTRGLPEPPIPPRAGREQADFILASFEQSCLKTPDGWGHAVVSKDSQYQYKPLWGSDFVSVIWEISGNLPDVPKLEWGGGHISNYNSLLLTGHGQALLNHVNGRAAALLARQKEDGSYRYSGKYLRCARYNYASGDCANSLYALMEIYRLTKNETILPAVKKGLDFVNKLKTPAGAQTWELSLHTPDIMGSSRCVLANVMYYEATGEQAYLDAAIRWAITGIPFVYLWEDPELTPGEQPMMRYATIAVFGATSWTAPNWMGRPVQWCGLDYAHALIKLAKHDATLDWAKIAEGIVASAECQLADEEFIGLLPDSFQLATQKKFPAYINSTVVWMLRRQLEGEPTNVCVVDCAGRRIVSPYQAEVDGNAVVIRAKEGTTYQIMIDGKELKTIQSKGEDRIEF